jgi:hypothetical protein
VTFVAERVNGGVRDLSISSSTPACTKRSASGCWQNGRFVRMGEDSKTIRGTRGAIRWIGVAAGASGDIDTRSRPPGLETTLRS